MINTQHSLTKFLVSLCRRKEVWLLVPALLFFSISHAQVKVLIAPAASEVAVGDILTVTVKVESGAQRVDGANIFLTFDPAVLTVVSATPGTALSTAIAPLTFNNTSGMVSYAYGTFADFPTGNFDLFSLQFRAIGSGSSAISFVSRNTIPSDLAYRGTSVLNSRENGQVTVSGTTTKTDQTISFTEITDKTFGDPAFALDATASSGLPVSFAVVSGPAELDGNMITLTGTGPVTIEATQEGDETYNAAPAVQRSFTVNAPAPLAQTIDFPAISNKTFGDAPFAVSATASSGLAVSFELVSGPAELAGTMLTITGAGDIKVKATQAGNGTYAPAPAVERTITVDKAPQTISFPALTNRTLSDTPFELSASSTSGLGVSFEVTTGPATLEGTMLRMTGVGMVEVTASQPGDENYLPAANVVRSFQVLAPTAVSCEGTGGLLWQQWLNVTGTGIAAIPINTAPDAASHISSFATPANIGNKYGSRVRGYICPPMSGQYTFYITGNDRTELWLSASTDPVAKVKIAYSMPADILQYDKYPTQQSEPVMLQAGELYYVEALHWESTYLDHLSVSWTLPDGTFQETIPGTNLVPYLPQDPEPPQVVLTAPANGSEYTAGAIALLAAQVTDQWARQVKVEFFNGQVKLGEAAEAPYTFEWFNLPTGTHTITARATDEQGRFSDAAPITISVIEPGAVSCEGAGGLLWQQWLNVTGTGIAAIPTNTAPDAASHISSFATPANIGNKYGSRVRGYICPPMSGQYTFYITGNDRTELWLSASTDPAAKVKIAHSMPADILQYDKYPTQQSEPVMLRAGELYYVEALHWESTYLDHLSVAWTLPDGTFQETIPGDRLVPYLPQDPEPPQVVLTAPASGTEYLAGATTSLVAQVTDQWARQVKVEFFNGQVKLGEAAEAPYTLEWLNLPTGTHFITAMATDEQGRFSVSAPITITVLSPTAASCEGTGGLLWQQWTGLNGSTGIASIPVTTTPTNSSLITSFATPADIGNKYGSRVLGYICPSMSGLYTFYISGNDRTELWLSSSADPAGKIKIAHSLLTDIRQYDKYPTQQSEPVLLRAGQRYYVEALHWENTHSDHLSVAWTLPDGTFQETIPGERLIPYIPEEPAASVAQALSASALAADGTSMEVYPNPSSGKVTIDFVAEAAEAAVLQVYDLKGTLLKTFDANTIEAGRRYSYEFDGSTYNSGVYICRLTLGKRVITKRLVIMH